VSSIIKSGGLYCATERTEGMAQSVRLAAGAVGGPLVVYAASKLDDQYTTLRTVLGLSGLACSVWNLLVWSQVRSIGGPMGFGVKKK
jgi:uncharacterized membrane protein YebE (DUF533 family)